MRMAGIHTPPLLLLGLIIIIMAQGCPAPGIPQRPLSAASRTGPNLHTTTYCSGAISVGPNPNEVPDVQLEVNNAVGNSSPLKTRYSPRYRLRNNPLSAIKDDMDDIRRRSRTLHALKPFTDIWLSPKRKFPRVSMYPELWKQVAEAVYGNQETDSIAKVHEDYRRIKASMRSRFSKAKKFGKARKEQWNASPNKEQYLRNVIFKEYPWELWEKGLYLAKIFAFKMFDVDVDGTLTPAPPVPAALKDHDYSVIIEQQLHGLVTVKQEAFTQEHDEEDETTLCPRPKLLGEIKMEEPPERNEREPELTQWEASGSSSPIHHGMDMDREELLKYIYDTPPAVFTILATGLMRLLTTERIPQVGIG